MAASHGSPKSAHRYNASEPVMLKVSQQSTYRNVKFANGQSDDVKVTHNASGPEQVADDPWAKRMALSLDGGGLRGLGQLLIVRELMIKIQEAEERDSTKNASSASSIFLQEHPKMYTKASDLPNLYDKGVFLPAHYFDYFAGTSAGGIIAILLGRLRCDINVAIEYYKGIWNGLGAGMTAIERMSIMSHAKKANTMRVQKAVTSILLLRDQQLSNFAKGNGSSTFVTDSSIAKTLVLTVEIDKRRGTQKPYLFRSYQSNDVKRSTGLNRPSRQDLDHVDIAHVASASCAAPRDFSSVYMRLEDATTTTSKFRDGSLWSPNPAMELYREILSMHGTVDNPRPVGMILSIGTGEAKSSGLRGAFRRRRSSASRTQRGELVDIDEQLHAHAQRDDFQYVRLPGPSYLNDLDSNKWQDDPSGEGTFERLQKTVRTYCKIPEVKKQLDACAEELVKVRKDRAKTQQWSRFALGIYYTCDLCGGKKREKYVAKAHKRFSAPPEAANLKEEITSFGSLLSPESRSLPVSRTPSSTPSIMQTMSGPPSLRMYEESVDNDPVDVQLFPEQHFDYNVDFVKHLIKEHAAPPPDVVWKEQFDLWVADRAHTVVR